MLFAETAWSLWWCEKSAKSNHDSSMSTSASEASLHSGRSCSTSPFASSRSWPSCPLCSLAFPPRWKPGRWGTSPDRARREDRSWWEKQDTRRSGTGRFALSADNKLRMSLTPTHFFKASLRFLNLPSDETSFCSLSIKAFVLNGKGCFKNNG